MSESCHSCGRAMLFYGMSHVTDAHMFIWYILHWQWWVVCSALTLMSCIFCVDIDELYILRWRWWDIQSALTFISCIFCVDINELYILRWRWRLVCTSMSFTYIYELYILPWHECVVHSASTPMSCRFYDDIDEFYIHLSVVSTTMRDTSYLEIHTCHLSCTFRVDTNELYIHLCVTHLISRSIRVMWLLSFSPSLSLVLFFPFSHSLSLTSFLWSSQTGMHWNLNSLSVSLSLSLYHLFVVVLKRDASKRTLLFLLLSLSLYFSTPSFRSLHKEGCTEPPSPLALSLSLSLPLYRLFAVFLKRDALIP